MSPLRERIEMAREDARKQAQQDVRDAAGDEELQAVMEEAIIAKTYWEWYLNRVYMISRELVEVE